MRREFDAARARVPQAKALPDPMFTFRVMTESSPAPLPGVTAFDEVELMAGQEFPWFGVRRLRGLVASSEAEAAFEGYAARARQVAAEVKSTAYELYALDRAIAVVARDSDILENFTKVAEARYEVGKGAQADVINARLEITELLDARGALEARRETTAARLNQLLFREPDSPVGAILPPAVNPDLPPLDALVEMAEAGSPELKERRRRIDASNHALRLAEREAKYPEVGLQVGYQRRPAAGANLFIYGVTLRVPLWSFAKQRYEVSERASELAAARSRLSSAGSMVRYRLSEARTRAATALRLLRLHEQGLVPQSALALESSMAAYQVGQVDFMTLLTALRKALQYETHYYELWADYQKAIAEIEALAGTELTR